MVPNFDAALKHRPCPHSPPAFGGAIPFPAGVGISLFPQPNPEPARFLRKAGLLSPAIQPRYDKAVPNLPAPAAPLLPVRLVRKPDTDCAHGKRPAMQRLPTAIHCRPSKSVRASDGESTPGDHLKPHARRNG